MILILSDGLENTAPFIADVRPDLLAADVVVHSYSLSQNADHQVVQLAASTGMFCCNLLIY